MAKQRLQRNFLIPALSLLAVALLGFSTISVTAESANNENRSTNTTGIEARFSLLNQHGQPVTEKTYRGKWLMVFFGYTSCPDICPTTLYDITLTLKAMDEDAERVQAIFITVDPERDTVDVLARYIPSFGSSIIGLTGKPEEVKQAARAFRAHYEKVPSTTSGGDYSVDHQSYIYLIRPDGSFETVFPHGMAVDRMSKALRRYMALAAQAP